MVNGKKCKSCLNDQSVPTIEFNEEGVCSFCLEHRRLSEKLGDFKYLNELFLKKIKSKKGKKDHDVLMGISGGKDSTYVAHKLQNEYGLRVKTFTFNNGFMTKWSKDRIEKQIKDMNLDHSYITLPKEQLSAIYRSSIKVTGSPCTACAYIMYASSIKMAQELDIPFAVHGRSRAQMLRFLSPESEDPFVEFIYESLKDPKDVDMKAAYGRVMNRIERGIPPQLIESFSQFFPDFNKDSAEFLPYFLYHKYDEWEIIKYIEAEANWRKPDDAGDHAFFKHYDCIAHDAAHYLYQHSELRPHVLPELSAMIREKEVTFQEAEDVYRKNFFTAPPKESLSALAEKAEMSYDDLIQTAKDLGDARKKRLNL